MMRSLYSGVSGLKTHQVRMDVIGNNIANVNTVAYKAQSMTFSELMYQTTQSASGPNAETGRAGINAKQIGLGVKSAAITTKIDQEGSTQSTGNPFDIKIAGDAFFVVSDGSTNYFTRDGSFYVDAVGNLATSSNGYTVMGWQVDPTTGAIKKDTVSPLAVMGAENMTYPPEATKKAYVSGIMDKRDKDAASESGKILNLGIFDNLGYYYTVKLTMKETEVEGQYSVEVYDLTDEAGKSVIDKYPLSLGTVTNIAGAKTLTAANGYTLTDSSVTYDGKVVEFANIFDDDDGTVPNPMTSEEKLKILANAYGYSTYDEFSKLYGTSNGSQTGTIDAMLKNGGSLASIMDATTKELNISGKQIRGGLVEYNISSGDISSINGLSNNLTLDLNFDASVLIPNGPFANINIDFSKSTNVNAGGTSNIGATAGDINNKSADAGRKVGKLNEIAIQNDGMIYAYYTNGQRRLLGQIAVAEFANASGLEKAGNNLYSATLNSGDFDGIGVDISANGGGMTTGELEMSNVDLSGEFTEMITTQRGFQANSRIITVSDTLLEELVNLKR